MIEGLSDWQVLDLLVEKGFLREQCARCEHEAEFHNDDETRRCDVCWDFCIYRPAYVPRKQRTPEDDVEHG